MFATLRGSVHITRSIWLTKSYYHHWSATRCTTLATFFVCASIKCITFVRYGKKNLIHLRLVLSIHKLINFIWKINHLFLTTFSFSVVFVSVVVLCAVLLLIFVWQYVEEHISYSLNIPSVCVALELFNNKYLMSDTFSTTKRLT